LVFPNDVADAAVVEPCVSELVGFIDCASAFFAVGGVIDDDVAGFGEAADDDEMAGGAGDDGAGKFTFAEGDGGDDGLALGDLRLYLVPVTEAPEPGIEAELAGALDGAGPVAEEIVFAVVDGEGVFNRGAIDAAVLHDHGDAGGRTDLIGEGGRGVFLGTEGDLQVAGPLIFLEFDGSDIGGGNFGCIAGIGKRNPADLR